MTPVLATTTHRDWGQQPVQPQNALASTVSLEETLVLQVSKKNALVPSPPLPIVVSMIRPWHKRQLMTLKAPKGIGQMWVHQSFYRAIPEE
jgi:hypothetical protein